MISACLHAGAIIVIVALTSVPKQVRERLTSPLFMPLDIGATPSMARQHRGGGGGGQRESLPARFGRLPRFATHEFVAPTTHLPPERAPLMMEPTILAEPAPTIQMIDFSQLGSPTGVHYGNSSGSGSDGGIGDRGKGGGVGDHIGPGVGAGDLPGVGDSTGSRVRGRMTAPVLLWKTEPEYSEDARRARIQGTVVVQIEIDAQGRPRNPRILQRLGLGLDERAVETVLRWKFQPAMRDGRPVAANAVVEVSFRLL